MWFEVNLDTFFQNSSKSEALLRQSVRDLAFWNMQQIAQSRLEKMNLLQLKLDIKVMQIGQLEKLYASSLSKNKRLTFRFVQQISPLKRIFEFRSWRIVRFFARSFRKVKKKFV
jgi:hypothetical protein